jgi:hypothetical protein
MIDVVDECAVCDPIAFAVVRKCDLISLRPDTPSFQ